MRNNKKRGFTLVELLVVIAILAILATVSVVTYTSYIESTQVRVDSDLANQLNHKLAAFQVDFREDITVDNIHEVTAAVLKDSGITELNPASADYGYHYYYNFETGKYELLHNNDAVDDSSILDKLIKFAFRASAEETASYKVTIGNCFTKGYKYFLVDTAGDLADVIKYYYAFDELDGDTTAEKFATYLGKVTNVEVTPITNLVNSTVFVTKDGNYVADFDDVHTNLAFVKGATYISNVLKDTDINTADITLGGDNYLLSFEKEGYVEIPEGTQLPTNSLHINTNGNKVVVELNASSWEPLEDIADRSFTNANVIVVLNGATYVVEDQLVNTTTLAGNTDISKASAILDSNFPLYDFNLEINNVTNKVHNVLENGKSTNTGYVGIDIANGFSFVFANVNEKANKPASTPDVTWSIVSLTVDGTAVANINDYISQNGDTITFVADENGVLPKVDNIVVKATANEPYGVNEETSEELYFSRTYVVDVVRINGVNLTLGGDDLDTDANAELVCNKGENGASAATTFVLDSIVRYNHEDEDGTPIADIVLDYSVVLNVVHEHIDSCCSHVHTVKECGLECSHTTHTPECMDCSHLHTDFDNYCCGHKHTDDCCSGKCSHVGGNHDVASGYDKTGCATSCTHNCLVTEACLTNCSHVSGGNHLDANGKSGTESACFDCAHGTSGYAADDYALTDDQDGKVKISGVLSTGYARKYACKSCPNYAEDGSHWCYSVITDQVYMGTYYLRVNEVYKINCSTTCCQTETNKTATTHTHGDACYGACSHTAHTTACVGTCSHTTHNTDASSADYCYSACKHSHDTKLFGSTCVNVCTHTHTATECSECKHKCTDDTDKDGTGYDCLVCTHGCTETDECRECEHECVFTGDNACTFEACLDRKVTATNSSVDNTDAENPKFVNAQIVGKGEYSCELTITIGGQISKTVSVNVHNSFEAEAHTEFTYLGSSWYDAELKDYVSNEIYVSDLFDGDIPKDAVIAIFSSVIHEEGVEDSYMSPKRVLIANAADKELYGDSVKYWADKNILTYDETNGWESFTLYGTKDGENVEGIYIAIFTDVTYDESGKIAGWVRISEDIEVKVVEAKNVRDYTEFDRSTAKYNSTTKQYDYTTTVSHVLLDDVRIPDRSDVKDSIVFYTGTLYGNCHTFDITNGTIKMTGNGDQGIITLIDTNMQDLRVIGKIYPTSTMAAFEDYGSNAVNAKGTVNITNCYIASCRSPLASGYEDDIREDNITITDSVLFGGRYATIDLRAGKITFAGDVYTINQPHIDTADGSGTKVAGLGIAIWFQAPLDGTGVYGADHLIQYNFISENFDNLPDIDVTFKGITVELSSSELLDSIFKKKDVDIWNGSTDYSGYYFGETGNRYVNAGIISEDLGDLAGWLADQIGMSFDTGDKSGFDDTTNKRPSGYGKTQVKQSALMGYPVTMHISGVLNTQTDLFTASQNAEYKFSPWDQTVNNTFYGAYDFTDGSILPPTATSGN